ncbi:glycosyltransferase [Nocardioides anomalus]|uniref:Glycosyltransferase n=1 Tax=Nocardioides anomalus TaxID=2712223 RepID=A0A6G6WEC9_9ACTN|nr:glycosyltransferase [Nocardioides anomalus]QIG43701.1 glycosyltransferase [Nocardioides anomalus]
MSPVWSAVLALVLLAVGTLAVRRLVAGLRVLPAGGPATGAAVSVVVPARDEAASLPTLLASVSRLDPAPAEVVVVDDGSSDGTGELARAGGARVVTLAGPPAGWTGKAWACQQGAEATSGELLLFLDADTVLAPGALGGLLAGHGRGLLSVQPFHAVGPGYEQLSAYPNAVSFLASGAFGAHPERRPMAFGPCLLTTRADYDRAGQHAAARADVLDDVALARAYDRAGLPVRCLAGGDALAMRMYPSGLGQLVEGWSKNVASGASAAAPGASVAATLWVAAHHAVAVGAVLFVVHAARGDAGAHAWVAAALWVLGWLGVALSLRALLRRLGAFAWWTWALFPLTLLAFDLVFLRSALLTLRGSVRWRGRAVATRTPEAGTEDAAC